MGGTKDSPAVQQHETSAGTLGAVLYADPTRAVVSEREWVSLVRAIAAGDVHALHALYQRTQRIVFTLIVRITANRETAEELTLDVFHDVWRRASAYDPAKGTVVGWVMNQARSRAIDRLRFEQRKKRVGQFPEEPDSLAMADGPFETLALRQQSEQLRQAMAVLTADERQALELAFFGGRTYEEAATELDEPLGTVKSRIRSALGKLRKAIAPEVQP